MQIGQVHVVVVVPHASLRASLVAWLRANKRVRLVRAVASVADLGTHHIDCDLVVASALDGPRGLRAIAKRFGKQAGLVALSLGLAPLPAGWEPVRPGAAYREVLDHAVPHPERSIANTSTVLAAAVAAVAGLVVAVFWIPATAASFERAALAYAARYPDTGTWWHIYGAGGPYLAAASWPLLRLAALTGGGPEVFILLAGAVAAIYAVAVLLLALRLGARHLSVVVALAAILPPALWVWPRSGDVSSLVGLTGVVLALAGTNTTRNRFLTTALATAASAFGGILWVLAAAAVVVGGGVRARRIRASLFGAVLGILASAAVTVPPLLSRGIDGLRPSLVRTPALSDAVPVVASAALVAMVLARGRLRRLAWGLAGVALVSANVLALQVPVPALDVPRVRPQGAMGRLAVHPAAALGFATLSPDLPTTGRDLSSEVMLGADTKPATNARLEWLGADRAVFPDRTSAIIFNERDWSLLDRDKLLFSAPAVRPILTAGVTPSLLVVADDADAEIFGEALIRIGGTSDRVIPVKAQKSLDELTRDELREFTMVVVYGRPWKDLAKAEGVLDDYLQLSGFVFMDAAGTSGSQPLVHDAEVVRGGADDVKSSGDAKLVLARGFDGRVVAIDKFTYRNDPGWEQAALSSGNKRLIQYGTTKVAGDVGVSAHLVWSGVDLPRRAARGEESAVAQLENALAWMIGAAEVTPTSGYGTPNGDVLDSELAKSTFLSPTRWRIELKVAATGVLFKERYDPQWRAYQVDVSGRQETRIPLKGLRATTHGYMYATLPPNARVIDFVFERHQYESATRGVSGISLFIIFSVAFFIARRR